MLDEKTAEYYKDKVVLITGGGGSIGSELCRQIAKMHPKQIIVLDIYENSAYDFSTECITLFDSTTEVVIVPKSKIAISVKG